MIQLYQPKLLLKIKKTHACVRGQTTWHRVRALLDDGHPVWTGWFDDRDDFDAFLFGLSTGHLDPYVRQLPIGEPWTGEWDGLKYDFSTVTFFTTTGSQGRELPEDWTATNRVECIAGGGGGAYNGSVGGGGGGGGGYASVSNLPYPHGLFIINSVGARGEVGAAGGDTYYNVGSAANASGGSPGTSAGSGGNPGTFAAGDYGYSGGLGGGRGSSNQKCAGGGGGSAGPSGNGSNGETPAGNTGGAGGNAGAAVGGSGGTPSAAATVGQAGVDWTPFHGAGAGGGGSWCNNSSPNGSGDSTASAAGGAFGAGGGGGTPSASGATKTASTGYQGLIVETYTPASAMFFFSQPF